MAGGPVVVTGVCTENEGNHGDDTEDEQDTKAEDASQHPDL